MAHAGGHCPVGCGHRPRRLRRRTCDRSGRSAITRRLTRSPTARRRHGRRSRSMPGRRSGRDVAIVSSGDPGHLRHGDRGGGRTAPGERSGRWARGAVTVVPGVTAATAAAARIGAPLGHDLCLVSLSDVLKPWEVIERRIAAAAMADFVLALYNPLSRHRPWQLQRALDTVGRHRSAETPVVEAHDVGRPEESIRTLTLGEVQPGHRRHADPSDRGVLHHAAVHRLFRQIVGLHPRDYPGAARRPGGD